MKVNQTNNLADSIARYLHSTTLAHIFTIGSLAIGISAFIATAPAQAISLENGDLTFGRGINNFLADVDPIAGDTIDVTFSSPTDVSSVNGSLVPFFNQPQPPLYDFSNPLPTARFNYVSGGASGFVYELIGNINFNFDNGVSLIVASGTLFNGSRNIGSVTLSTIDKAGSSFQNDRDTTPLKALSFGLNAIGGDATGAYSVIASTQPPTSVPEPLTIVATMFGGAAAMRLRNKLAIVTQR
jgi:hypothetical protein